MNNKLEKYFDSFDPFPTTFPSSFSDTIDRIFKGLDVYNIEDGSWKLNKGFPKGDIIVEDNRATVELALAGYGKDQLSITVENDSLMISSTKCENSDGPRTLTRRAFSERIYFGQEFDLEKSEATYVDGLLRIIVPKFIKEQTINKVIEIK
jgi:HSP20 family molecular chaperone IbpA